MEHRNMGTFSARQQKAGMEQNKRGQGTTWVQFRPRPAHDHSRKV